MAVNTEAYVLSKGYTAKSLTGAGALKGEKGDTGDSAYEIAIKNGFIGTEEEWLESLKMDVTELQSVVQQEVADQIGDTVDEKIDDNTATNADIDVLW